MTVLWWLPELAPDQGGIATLAGQVTPALRDVGVDLFLFVMQGGPGESEHEGIPMLRQPIWAAFKQRDARAIALARRDVVALKQRVRPDLYHVHLSEPSPILHLTTLDAHRAPLVLTLHSEVMQILHDTGNQSLLGKLFEEAAIVTAVSNGAAAGILAARPELAAKLIVVPNGLAVGSPAPPLAAEPNVLACGRLVAVKGFDRLVNTLPALLESVPGTHLRIAGDGPQRAWLEAQCDRLGVRDAVTFLGHVERADLQQHFEWARVLVAPSHREGMPMVVLEAGERGRPVVATDIGGLNELVVPDVTGLLVDPAAVDDDLSILAEAIRRVLVEPGLGEALGIQARARVVDRFSMDTCAQTYATVYRAVTTPREPLVSVVIPAFQAERFIGDALRSVLRQCVDSIEIVVVDDGSSDRTADVARGVGGANVIILRQPNRGAGAARNTAVALARGKYIAHLDADDIWPDGRLAALLRVIEADDNLDAVFGRAVEFADVDAPPSAQVVTTPKAVRIPTTGVMRRDVHARFGPLPVVRSSDLVAWTGTALGQGLRYTSIDDVVLRRRIHGTNNSHLHPFLTDPALPAALKTMLDARRRQQ